MSGNLTMALINNAALLLALGIIFEITYIFNIRSKLLSQVLSGIMIGLIGIAIMSTPYELVPGVFYDTRSILLCVAALVFGYVPASVAGLITITFRLFRDGAGLVPGISMIIVSVALGLLFRHIFDLRQTKLRWLKLYAVGLCVHVFYLIISFMLPRETALTVLRQITFPILVIYPVGVVLLSLLLLVQREYREAQLKAVEAESRYKSLFYNDHAVMFLIDPESGSILDTSPAAERFYGWSQDTLKSMNVSELNTLPPDAIRAEMEKSLTGRSNYFLFKHNRAAGGPVDVEVYSGPIEYSGKKYIYSIVHDISERTAAIRALQESEARFRTLVDNAPDTVFEIVDHRFTFINKAGLKLLGVTAPEELLGTDPLDVMLPDNREEVLRNIQELNDQKIAPHSSEQAYVRRDKSLVYVDATAALIPYGSKVGTLVFARDVSERREALRALQESEARFRTLVDNAPDAIFVLIGGKFTFVNNAGLKLLGAAASSDLLGRRGLSIIHPDYHASVDAYMEKLRQNQAAALPYERAYIRLDGTIVYVDVIVVPIRYDDIVGDLVIARDITERRQLQQKAKEMEAQLRQQQKLEAIGTLAGGVAHEINNPLNGVMNYAQLILDRVNAIAGSEHTAVYSGITEYAGEIIRETERISTIVKNLLQFSRHEKQSHSYASIYDIVGQTVSLVKTIIKKDQIILDIALDADLPQIKCRSQQIQQVIMNLLTNARDAVNEKYPGYDENKIIQLHCSESQKAGRRWLRLEVTDHGSGIAPEARDRIFEPFFSTKPKELGTGLGLSISYGIVNEHHGRIFFESEYRTYTKFIVELPFDNGWALGEEG